MPTDWTHLSDELQLLISRTALLHAAQALAAQADLLAEEMDAGALRDKGGPEALRLFASVVRASHEDPYCVAGHA